MATRRQNARISAAQARAEQRLSNGGRRTSRGGVRGGSTARAGTSGSGT